MGPQDRSSTGPQTYYFCTETNVMDERVNIRLADALDAVQIHRTWRPRTPEGAGAQPRNPICSLYWCDMHMMEKLLLSGEHCHFAPEVTQVPVVPVRGMDKEEILRVEKRFREEEALSKRVVNGAMRKRVKLCIR